jgi:hypothetical protein
MQKEGRDPQISIDREIYDFIIREAKKNKRTIKGQVEYMIELVKQTDLEANLITTGKAEYDGE